MFRPILLGFCLVVVPLVVSAQLPNGSRHSPLTSRAQAARALDSYFAAMHSHDFSSVPFTREAVFRGSLHTQPIRGDSAVRAFLVAVAEGARSVQPQWRVIDGDRACVHYEYHRNEGAVIPVVACFRFEAGRIAEERAFFDPRPLLTPAQESDKDTTRPH
jgi:SnoaL-like protein